MSGNAYRFGPYRLISSARELWRDDSLLHVPRRAFDCLAYLIEHRERAVGRDELIAALWGRVDVTDTQVNQAVLRARIAVDDGGQAQQKIRTVPGFGYRWVANVEALEADEPSQFSAPPVPAAKSGHDVSSAASDATPIEARRRRSNRFAMAIAALSIVSVLALVYVFRHRAPETSPSSADTPAKAGSIAVLPIDVTAPREDGWVRLGAMDLVAERLRSAGLSVTPSDNVVAALRAVGEPLDAEHMQKLKQTLGTTAIVRGNATRSATGWTFELAFVDADGTQHRQTASQSEMTEAARRSSDLLVAALGRIPFEGEDDRDDRAQLLARAEAALLANELDTARSILAAAPESMRGEPALRAKSALLEFRAGHAEAADKSLAALLAEPATHEDPRAEAQALTTRGFIAIRGGQCATAEPLFDRAVASVHDAPSHERDIALAARGLARACLRKFEEAAADLGRARVALAASGDRLGLAKIDNYFGILETRRNRMSDAVPYFTAAAATVESFGVVESLRANLSALCLTQMRLLRWADALATSGRLEALRSRIADPTLLASSAGLRARTLTALGRWSAAEDTLRAAQSSLPDAHGEPTLYLNAARAELALRQRRYDEASAAAQAALDVMLSASDEDDELASTSLLRQRASIAAGKGIRADAGGENGETDRAAAWQVASAEWAAHERRDADADAAFHAAVATAERRAIPDEVALVAESYGDWLLARGRTDEASALAGRVAGYADRDFDCAMLEVKVFHATDQHDAWAVALKQARSLAGERTVPAELAAAPGAH